MAQVEIPNDWFIVNVIKEMLTPIMIHIHIL